MMVRIVTILTLLQGAIALPTYAQSDGSKVYRQVVPSVVWVHSPQGRGLATGSGALVDRERRLVLTNYHVVDNEDRVRVFFPAFRNERVISEKSYYSDRIRQLAIPGRVVARDTKADLALIQIDRVPKGVPALTISATGAEPGQNVHAIGNAGASDALWGYVPGKVRQVYRKTWAVPVDRSKTYRFQAQVVETDSPTNPGDSGGPLVNDQGELVGVTQGGVKPGAANLVSTFIDVSEVRRILGSTEGKRVKADAPKVEVEAPKRTEALAISDGAKLFKPEAIKTAQETVNTLFSKHQVDVLVETHPAVRDADLDRVKAMSPRERTDYMRTWIRSREVSEGVRGIAILISNDPKSLYVDITPDVTDQFPKDIAVQVRDILIKHMKDRPDQALTDAVAKIAELRGKP